MKLGLIGCGRVGTTIGYFLRKSGLLFGVYDKIEQAQKRAVKLLDIKDNPDYVRLIKESNVLFFATADDEILNAYHKSKKYIKGQKILFHFSGLLPAEIFPDNKNIYRGSVHPFATFPKIVIPPKKKKYLLLFQGDEKSFRIACKIFSKKNFLIYKIQKMHKPFYHLLGVFSSNFLVAMNEAMLSIAKKIGWNEKTFKEIVIPLIEETLNNLKNYGIKKALSGPIKRGDIKTIKSHLRILKSNKNLYNLYKELSRLLIRYAPTNKQGLLRSIFV